ncbi:3'-5' exoribonuclease YhaM family protein [Anaerolentibacter hominis]|uniref:3'-5' exoribonuclease YhaM family protein n=1 Tax=Anaerolentibacter hominis TaxID=3079009 RepID=UPI0031B83DC0
MRYIKELRDGEMIQETYLCKTKQSLKTKAGKSYYSLLLQDKTGTIDAKIWELSNGIDHFEAMDYIKVDAQVVLFQNSPQLNIRRVRKSSAGEYDMSDYMPTTEKNVEAMCRQLNDYIASIEEPHLKQLLEKFFVEDTAFLKTFINHSAAKTVHHSFMGGLLEHTLSVAENANYMAEHYTYLNRDLLVSAAILHDIGKTRELSAFPENDYTDDGQFLGHIYMGTEMISDKIREISGFPVILAGELKHCILSHHGELEYGSPKKPAIAEAVALNLADNMDAKLQTLLEVLKGGEEKAEWLGYNRLFESNIRRTTI